jgi:hypothetical protein
MAKVYPVLLSVPCVKDFDFDFDFDFAFLQKMIC